MASGRNIPELPRRTALLGLAGLGALTLGGCRLAVNEARGADGGGPRQGGTLILAVNSEPTPARVQSQGPTSTTWRDLVFETLTAYDSSGTPQPALATSWELADGGRTVTLRLRDDVRFHTGRPMTAQDVMFSLRRTTQPAAQSQVSSISKLIKDMSAPDAHTVVLRLSRQASNLFDLFQFCSVVDEESARGLDDGSAVIGTGPFRWESWTPGSQLTLVRNTDYRVPGRPYLDRIEQPLITDPTALVTAIRGGRAHIAYGVGPMDARGLSTDDRFTVNQGISVAYSAGMNVTKPPFDKVEVRQAVGYAVDRKRALNQIFAGYGESSSLWWTRKEPGWDAAQAATYTYDPARAKAMIAGAGAAGARVTMDVIGIQAARSLAEVVRYDLEAAGLRVAVRVLDTVDFTRRMANSSLEGELFLNGYGLSDMSAATFVSSVPAFALKNASRFESPEYATVMNQVLTASPGQRQPAVRRLGTYLQEQAFEQCFLVTQAVNVQSNRVRDLGQTAVGSFVLTDTYLV
ncbi:peptide/nickel transport system substrate-binding protein [Amycolatopsis sacchari]|uniref:Peptide/nickel transport system substrate-binding protein n=1 Tax=Amycolatopsis sacchari TaxID=115433 RepID=A0A1I3RFW7_9PSEU|nr:ABC transporter substrate-binding protein [Amycolatopsis sacchari]SFJ45473.1 peptide/nickel transport system substrate-binding protein [Amycolatopsis sacchari]